MNQLIHLRLTVFFFAAALFLLLMAAATPPLPDLMFSKEMAVRRLCLPPDRTSKTEDNEFFRIF